jgi:hypothetical protein
MWLHSSATALTPDRSVRWQRRTTREGDLYLAKDAPTESVAWLTVPSGNVGRHIGTGQVFGRVYGVQADNRYALKESTPPFRMTEERWSRYCGLGSLCLNVGLQAGLERIGDGAFLPNGTKVTTPQYYGLLVGAGVTRLLMSFEAGTHPQENSSLIGSEVERRMIYDAAVQAVGVDPSTIGSYDDKPENLLTRPTDSGLEAVKIDACNWPIPGRQN